MLPPLDVTVFEQNPKFKAFYTEFTASKLHPDGSTKDSKREKEIEDVRKKLNKLRVEAARQSLITEGLLRVVGTASEIPVELREVIQLVCALLNGLIPSNEEDLEILRPDIDAFLDHITPISSLLSDSLSTTHEHLYTIASAPNSSSSVSPSSNNTSTLPSQILSLSALTTTRSHALQTAKSNLTQQAVSLLALHRVLLETSIKLLEQVQHGALARYSRARAEHLSVVAKGMELKLALLNHPSSASSSSLSSIGPGGSHGGEVSVERELNDALAKYETWLRERKRGLMSKRVGLKRVLDSYEDGDDEEIGALVKRYVALKEEKVTVMQEIEKLEGR